jgi:HEAT repeat protein
MNASPAQPVPRQVRATAPLLIVVLLWFGGIVALFTYGGRWFGATADSTLEQHLLSGDARQRRDALLELAGRMKRRDPEAVKLYPAILRMSASSDAIVRGGAAWAMGMDPSRNDFRQTLLNLLQDPAPNVQANASVSLVRFDDAAGRQHLREMLQRGDPDAVWESLRALKAVGKTEDLANIAPYETGAPKMPERVREAAKDAAQAIRERE